MSLITSNVNLTPLIPELILIGGLLVLLVIDLIVKQRHGVIAAIGSTVLLVIIAFFTLSGDISVGSYLFGSVVQDGITSFFRLFFVSATIISIGILVISFPKSGEPFFLIVSGLLGMFLLAGANDLVTLFIALELVSIPSYVLAGFRKSDSRSAEAALKYVLFGAMSSGLMLYGFSILYGLSGTTNLPDMAIALAGISTASSMAHIAGLVLVFAGIGYKIAMVPFHFWCPDVYEGSPTPITAFFSVAPKAAGFAALLRLIPVFNTLEPIYGITSVGLFTLAAAVTMTFGNLGAIWQDSLKRLLAYSSIAHAGYILMGFAVMAAYPEGEIHTFAIRAVLFYLVVYLFMNLGGFLIIDMVERKFGSDDIAFFKGLGKRSPLPALALAVFLFSLVGLPPLAGFIGKFFLFAALVKGELWGLAMIGIANSVIALFYYVRVIRDMFLEDPSDEVATGVTVDFGTLTTILVLITLVPTVILGVWWGPLAEWIKSLV